MGQDFFSGPGDDTKTVVRPSPGGRKRQTASPEGAAAQRTPLQEGELPSGMVSGANQLTASALSLLMVVPKLRKLAYHSSVGDLQDRLITEVGSFQNRALQQGYTEEQVRTASYFLCSLVDETVLNTPWGSESNWGHDSLLVKFHHEAWGGEEFFKMVDRFFQRPTQNLDLLELAFLCLSLGFEGKYRLIPNGMASLEQLRIEIYSEIQRIRGDLDRSLSVNWKGLRDLRSPLTRFVPLWVLTVVSGLLILLIFLGFSYALNMASNRIYGDWMTIAVQESKVVAPEPPPVVIAPAITPPPQAEVQPPVPNRAQEFADLLADEIGQGKVIVLEGPIVRLTNAFQSGSDQLRKDYIPLLVKIARQLKNDTSRVEVIGHTDNKPIFTARFPSNWDLSNARAKAVANFLDSTGSLGTRITLKGKADSDPIAPNDTPEHRALNRRTDIHIYVR
ncbi:MAG: type IVB secretion system protein IcmH/DotU [Syntrophobacter sp.]